jgi:hypothetical protein
MSEYCVWIISPEGYVHSAIPNEVALGLQGGLQELGIHAPIITDSSRINGTAIVLGANLLPAVKNVELPCEAIVFNLEQIFPGSPWVKAAYLRVLKRHIVWDYSERNILRLEQLGIRRVAHCPIGYSDALCRIPMAGERDIDVLFYGSVNTRREVILDRLENAGLKVERCFGLYGDARDEMIARSKVVINIHYYATKIFETVRISYLLANRICVLSEESRAESSLERVRDGIVMVPYDELVERCISLVQGGGWEAVGQRGFDLFSAHRQSDALLPLI